MTFKKLTYASVVTCFSSFLSLLFCASLSTDAAKMKEWLVGCFFCFIVSFISARVLREKKKYVDEENRTVIGESSFEVTLVTMILWLPVLLALYAIGGIMLLHVDFEKVGWVLVVLAGNTGFQAAKLSYFSPRD